MMNRGLFFFISLFLIATTTGLQAKDRWSIRPDGAISWKVEKGDTHADHIEMSGLRVSTVLRYGVDSSGAFQLSRSVVWPMLRTLPNNTHASLTRRFSWDIPTIVLVDGRALEGEQVTEILLKGYMEVKSEFVLSGNRKMQLTRVLFPSTTQPLFCEKYTLRNIGTGDLTVEVPAARNEIQTDAANGVSGSYKLVSLLDGQTTCRLKAGEEVSFGVTFSGYKPEEKESPVSIDSEFSKRKQLIEDGLWRNLKLETPDPVINTMFAFAKIRASESIYDTQGGLMHGPGGESYYAAIWANDQAEYVNPFFPFLGYDIGNRSALNSFRHFSRFMNPGYDKIPSSIIAEGLDVWGGAGDRGDAAMVAYGAARYALALGNEKVAEELWPQIEWCLEYCRRNLNEKGVVASDADELENRFPAGKANLCTSTLYYDALLSAAYLGKDLKKPSAQVARYKAEAKALRKNIDSYFGGEIEGFDSYRYYEGNDVLRSWICMPLTVGIYDRKEATINALFSPRLWTENGLLTQAGSETFWDRSTLYALRGVYACGEADKATEYLKFYSRQRLLGDHVPYAIEAWPEGSQRHLSAESGLYCRIITEGMFGIRPTGLKSFSITPSLPQEWDTISLSRVLLGGYMLNISVTRQGKDLIVNVSSPDKAIVNKKIKVGNSVEVRL